MKVIYDSRTDTLTVVLREGVRVAESDGFVRRFASEVVVGDVCLLRTGSAKIAAVGLVTSDYLYVNAFDDVNGWDLQHGRRVRWCRLPEEHVSRSAVFGANPPRCSRVWNEEVLDLAARFLNSPPTHWQTAPLPDLPAEEPPLEEVPHVLQGIAAQTADLVPLLQDRQALTLVVADPEVEWSGGGPLRTQIAEWIRQRGKSPRLYPGALVWCLKKPGRDLREKVELGLAWKRVAREVADGTLGGEFDKSDRAELQSNVKIGEDAAKDEVWAGYRFAVVADGQEPDGLKVIDLGAGHSSRVS